MLKHTGQYTCQECALIFKTKNDLRTHSQDNHVVEATFDCTECDKTFTSQVSLNQHKNTKHKNTTNFPVGHEMWRRDKASEPQEQFQICACTECGETFASIKDLENHVQEHKREIPDGFQKQIRNKPCRFFNRGYCAKGEQCAFSHKET